MAQALSRFRFRFRFSLRTLLLLVMLIGSGTTLWWRWAPWEYSKVLCRGDAGEIISSNYSGERTLFAVAGHVTRVWYAAAGKCISEIHSRRSYHRLAWFSPGSRMLATC